jgi:adenosylhomocysteine nucleosidase
VSSITPALPGFVVGLAIEARVLARALGSAGRIACAGASAARAREGAQRLLSEGAGALISLGIAGGLDPALAPGDLVLPERVVAPGAPAIAVDPARRAEWAAAAVVAGLPVAGGTLTDSTGIVTTVADKETLHRSTGAVAADMESYAVGAVAAEAGVPFAAVRAVADPAGRALPRAVIGIIGPDGMPDIDRLILRLCLRPWDGPALFRLRRDTDAALASLGRLVGGFGSAGLV